MLYFSKMFEQDGILMKPVNYLRSRPNYKPVRNLAFGLGTGSMFVKAMKNNPKTLSPAESVPASVGTGIVSSIIKKHLSDGDD